MTQVRRRHERTNNRMTQRGGNHVTPSAAIRCELLPGRFTPGENPAPSRWAIGRRRQSASCACGCRFRVCVKPPSPRLSVPKRSGSSGIAFWPSTFRFAAALRAGFAPPGPSEDSTDRGRFVHSTAMESSFRAVQNPGVRSPASSNADPACTFVHSSLRSSLGNRCRSAAWCTKSAGYRPTP